MQTLLYVVVASAVIIAAVLAYAAMRPDSFRIERRTRIDAPPDRIFPLVSDFASWKSWSPYEARDPAMRRSLSGPPGGTGAVYAWDGNNQVGHGRMEIVESTPPSRLLIKLDFFKPIKANNMAEFTFTPVGSSTDVTWAMYGPSPYMSKLMGLVMNFDKMVGRDFEAGLANLKAQAEG